MLSTLPWVMDMIVEKQQEPSIKRARTEPESNYHAIRVGGCGWSRMELIEPSPPPVVLSK